MAAADLLAFPVFPSLLFHRYGLARRRPATPKTLKADSPWSTPMVSLFGSPLLERFRSRLHQRIQVADSTQRQHLVCQTSRVVAIDH